MHLTKFSLNNPAAIVILCFMLIGGGLYAWSGMKTELMPEVNFPEIMVSVVYPGASAHDVYERVTKVLEAELKGLEELLQLETSSFESFAMLQLEFPIQTNMEKKVTAVREIVAQAALPDSAAAEVEHFTFDSLPVLAIDLVPAAGARDFEAWVSGELLPELLDLQGVKRIDVNGLGQPWLEIVLNKQEAQKYGLTVRDIQRAFEQSSFSYPAGMILEEGQGYPIRIHQELQSLEELLQLKLTSPATGEQVYMRDLAEIVPMRHYDSYTRYNLQASISLFIIKSSSSNTADVAGRVLEVLDRYSDRAAYAISMDYAETIRNSVNGMVQAGLLGAVLATLIVYLFLQSLRATLITLLSIPLSILMAAIVMRVTGMSLNVMTLAAIVVSVGRVVDDSMIVIENVYRKFRLHPEQDRTWLTIQGTKEMMGPIITSTLTSILVFLPLGLLGGGTDMGEFALPLALTMVYALSASTVIALTIVPVLARYSFFRLAGGKSQPSSLERIYGRVIRWSLARKRTVFAISVALLAVSLPIAGQMNFIFLNNEERRMLLAEVVLPASATLDRTNELAVVLEERLMADNGMYLQVFSRIGAPDMRGGAARPNQAQLLLLLADGVQMEQAIGQAKLAMEEQLIQRGVQASVNVQEAIVLGPPTTNHIYIDLFGESYQQLELAASQVEEMLRGRDDVRGVRNSVRERQKQWMIHLDPHITRELGITPEHVLGAVAEQLRPIELAGMRLGGEYPRMRLRYDTGLTDGEELKEWAVYAGQVRIPLTALGDIRLEETVSVMHTLNGQPFARISSYAAGQDMMAASQAVGDAVSLLDLPQGVTYRVSGGSDETAEMLVQMFIAISVAIGLVYITMLVFFGKARLPFLILSTLLFVPSGSFLALWIAGEPLSMSAMIGLLMLVGIVTANAIVLIDRVNQNRDAGMTIREAVIDAGQTRIGPILMTALATILALLPLAWATPDGGVVSRGLALVVIGGLLTSTLLTLIVAPILYELAFIRTHRQEQAVNGK